MTVSETPSGSDNGPAPRRRHHRWKPKRRPWIQRHVTRASWFFAIVAGFFRLVMGMVHLLGRPRADRFVHAIVRTIGPLTGENGIAKANIAAAFPDKSEAERKAILDGCWHNLARVLVEFVFLEELAAAFDPERPSEGPITVAGIEHFVKLRDDGKPAVIFAAHLANWELLGVVATKYGLDTVLPYRVPGNVFLANDVMEQREALMGQLVKNRRGAAFAIAAAMDRGAHLGILIDQRLQRGVRVPFFDRPAPTNPMAANFARQYDCPVHGARAIRLPGNRLHLELTPAIEMPRDADGLIDVTGATARINEVVEGWVREHPEQWLWLHNRWRQ